MDYSSEETWVTYFHQGKWTTQTRSRALLDLARQSAKAHGLVWPLEGLSNDETSSGR